MSNMCHKTYEMLLLFSTKIEKWINLVFLRIDKYTDFLLPTDAFHFASGRKACESHQSFQNMYPTILDTDISGRAAMIFRGKNTCPQCCKCKIWNQGSG